MQSVSHATIWQCWKGSSRADTPAAPKFQPIPKREAVRFYHQAVKLNARTRAKGHQDGRLGRNGLMVLHALIFEFLNHKTGQCDPDYESIAGAAGMSPRSVARGIQKLRAAGLISWVRRCIADTAADGRFMLRQISNAYEITLKALVTPAPAPAAGTWGDHPAGVAIDGPIDAARAWEGDSGLDGALARMAAQFLKKI